MFVIVLAIPGAIAAHDLERTQVLLTFARDGSFVLDVSNDPGWLKLRLEPFQGNFVDRIVLWVDGREIRPTSVEYLPSAERPDQDRPVEGRATYRLRGRMPLDARTLRWYYGLVGDPYPMTIRRADGRIVVEEIAGNAWSGTIDLSGQFQQPRIADSIAPLAIVALFLIPIAIRIANRARPRQRRSAQRPQSRACRAGL